MAEQRVDVPNIRLQIVIDLSDTTSSGPSLLSDRGPLDTTITFIKSTDRQPLLVGTGQGCSRAIGSPLRTSGTRPSRWKWRPSRATSIEAGSSYWSHEEQQRRHTGTTREFAYLRPTTDQRVEVATCAGRQDRD